MGNFIPSSFFTVDFIGPFVGMSGDFTSVSGLGMELEYETYNEGGSTMPKHFFKGFVPQTLVLEQGTVTDIDVFANWMTIVGSGVRASLNGIVTLKDKTGKQLRVWNIIDAMLTKYVGPSLNGMQSVLAVSRIEMIYSGCY